MPGKKLPNTLLSDFEAQLSHKCVAYTHSNPTISQCRSSLVSQVVIEITVMSLPQRTRFTTIHLFNRRTRFQSSKPNLISPITSLKRLLKTTVYESNILLIDYAQDKFILLPLPAYGLTESAGIITLTPFNLSADRLREVCGVGPPPPGTCGMLYVNTEAKVCSSLRPVDDHA
jgi:hypothetical protein